ncbi:tetratricopeptide repeat protein 39C-like isoform X1 [Cloeon dipterum]|uniref:tetratricopeptide repeat protein 39C-like isoform X1 n=1 Tax=Cloeon dipterum TaxID=197152 RepID=UPI00321F929E
MEHQQMNSLEEYGGGVDEEDDWHLAKQGIQLLLNNKIDEAETLFRDRKENVQMAAGYCYITFMNAVMTFEEEKLQEAVQVLKDMEKRCAQDMGWIKTVKNKVFGASNVNEELLNRLEEQIILADTQVCMALLTFLQHDLTGYVRGGWILRKAWKVYQHSYNQVLQLHRRTFGHETEVPGSQFPSWSVIVRDSSQSNLLSPSSPDWTVPSTSTTPSQGLRSPLAFFSMFGYGKPNEEPLAPSTVSRLMAAVSFGYGIFQLCISLLPPSLLKLISFLGFEGDRDTGIAALMYARQGQDMRAPLASLSLLWYHTIVRPFFALDGSNVQAGVAAAETLISESQETYGQSALFLFFRGRVERLKSNVSQALLAYQAAVKASPQREIQLLCLHEVGWCHLILLHWPHAHVSFLRLKKESRWSKCFYAYLAAVCRGAAGDEAGAIQLAQEAPKLSTNRQTQLEVFIARRTSQLPLECYTTTGCKLLAFELLFLWNALPSCSALQLQQIIQECDSTSDPPPMQGLQYLIMGATYGCLGQAAEAISNFRACLESRSEMSRISADGVEGLGDHHIAAFASYELAVLLCMDSETQQEGIDLLLEVQNNYRNYDFENRLNVRVHSVLKNFR